MITQAQKDMMSWVDMEVGKKRREESARQEGMRVADAKIEVLDDFEKAQREFKKRQEEFLKGLKK